MSNNHEIYPESSTANLTFKTKAILLADQAFELVVSSPDLAKFLRSDLFSIREALEYCDPCSIEAVASDERQVLQFLEELDQELIMLTTLEMLDKDRPRYLINRIHRGLAHRNALLLALKQQS